MRALSERIGSPRAYGAGGVGLKACLVALTLSAATASADEITIAALGDSLTQGYGLYPGEGFVPQLEAWLLARGHDVAILNAGVSGDTTAGGLARIDWTLTPEVDALIVALGGNDLLRGIDPAVSRANLDGILTAAGERGLPVLLIGLQASNNYGPDYRTAFNAMYPDLAEAHGAILAESFFQGFELGEDRAEAARTLMQPDGIHPSAEGVARIVDGLGPQVEALIARVPSSS